MAVSVSKIMSLPSFRKARILTGYDYLDNTVLQVSITDSPLSEIDETISKPGDFYLSEFYFAKDNAVDMINYLKPIISSKSSGICIVDEYVQTIPREVLDYCNENGLPVIMNSVNVPYATMIREIMELIIADGQKMLLQSEFETIAADTIDDVRKLSILKHLNPRFLSYITVFYIAFENGNDSINYYYNLFNNTAFCSALLYHDGLIGIVSYGDSKETSFSRISYFADKIKSDPSVKGAGISASYLKQHDISKALNQALSSARFAFNSNECNLFRYSELGIMKLLLLMTDRPELEDYCDEILSPVINYDKENNSQLYETMCTFVNSHYQFRETAQKMFVHENTVRYRIAKVREIIEPKTPVDDYKEAFSFALKCRNILNEYR